MNGLALICVRQLAHVGEVLMEVLFRRKDGAPGGRPAATVVERAHHRLASRIDAGLEPLMAHDWPGETNGRHAGKTAIHGRALPNTPVSRLVPSNLYDGAAMGGQLSVHDLLSRLGVGLVVAHEHELRIRVFVVYPQQAVVWCPGPLG